MSTFNPGRLSARYLDGVTAMEPVIPRRYTLTHSDDTGELFLDIGTQYAWDKINPLLRDEVLGEWDIHGDRIFFNVYLYIDQGEFEPSASARRNEIFRKELPLALTAIRYGDRAFFTKYHFLNQVSILVHFMSAYPEFARQEEWGTFQDYNA